VADELRPKVHAEAATNPLQLARLEAAVPLMTGLGPLMVVQYGYWVRRRDQERTTWEYLQVEPLDRRRTASSQI
jgi:hypothetical protein